MFSTRSWVTFYDNPTVIIDLSRTESRMMNNMGLYTTLENVSGNFHSTKYQGGQVTWWKPPKLLVLANDRPNPKMLSPDRFDVYIVQYESLDLMKDTPLHEQLADYAEELKRLQAAREAEIAAHDDGETERERDPRDETEAIFQRVYKVVPGAKAIPSRDMHF